MNIPLGLNYASLGALASSVRTALTAISAGWNIEHRPNGRHRLPWVDVARSTGDFTADTGTWTPGTDFTLRYWLVDHTMHLEINIFGSSLSSTPIVLTLRVPGGRTVAKSHLAPLVLNDNGTYRLGRAQAIRDTATIQITIAGTLVAFASSSSNTGIHGAVTFEVRPE